METLDTPGMTRWSEATVAAREAVMRGAALLDERRPGWHREIDSRRLYVSNCQYCVLGQLYGQYIHGLNALGITPWQSADYGFHSSRGNSSSHGFSYGELDSAWRAQVRIRLAVEAAMKSTMDTPTAARELVPA